MVRAKLALFVAQQTSAATATGTPDGDGYSEKGTSCGAPPSIIGGMPPSMAAVTRTVLGENASGSIAVHRPELGGSG